MFVSRIKEVTCPALPCIFLLLILSCKSTKNTEAVSDREILEKYWKLIELDGSKPEAGGEKSREAYLSLKAEGNKLTGSGTCNRFTGNYAIQPGNKINFNGIAATKMHCSAMETEKQFFEALGKVDHFLITGDTLVLMRAKMAPLAKFEVVYMH